MIWPLPEDADLPASRRPGVAWTAAGNDVDPHGAGVTRDRHAAARAETTARHDIQISAEEALAFTQIVQRLSADDPVCVRAVVVRRIAALTATGLVWMLLSVLMVTLGWAGVLVTVTLSAGTTILLALHLRHRGRDGGRGSAGPAAPRRAATRWSTPRATGRPSRPAG